MALTHDQKHHLQRQLRRRQQALQAHGVAPDAELGAIARALEYLSDDEYGHCLDCGADMTFERLRTAPTALRCARCQSLGERSFAHRELGVG
jgi:RNA polymerase-binding transcription factor DksA